MANISSSSVKFQVLWLKYVCPRMSHVLFVKPKQIKQKEPDRVPLFTLILFQLFLVHYDSLSVSVFGALLLSALQVQRGGITASCRTVGCQCVQHL